MRRTAAVVLGALILLVTGCSDGDNSASSSVGAGDEGLTTSEIEAAGGDIDDEWGAESGFSVTVLSLDAGYSVDQIVADPSIDVSGELAGVEPAGPDLGLVADPDEPTDAGVDEESLRSRTGPGVVLVAQQEDGVNPADAYVEFVDDTLGEILEAGQVRLRELEEADDYERSLTTVVLGLSARGYSLEQIIDALLERTLRVDSRATLQCVVITEDGNPEPPYLAPEGTDLLGGDCPDVGALEVVDGSTADDSGDSDVSGSVEPASWEGELVATEDVFGGMDEHLDGHIAVDRLADGTFTVSAFVEFRVVHEEAGCEDVILRQEEFVGELSDDGARIDLTDGTEGLSDVETTCLDEPLLTETQDLTGVIMVDGGTLSGFTASGVEFELEGPPVAP